ncbi:hypothetical protein AAFF_G00021470 [Aldrovandia affinis]|uniref:PiggyBac transposable element-derived protein domain-containing protein n=1 Tax=Aldrovandia affinis TaxID=143900 RepID=A0AAD7VY42_9TELE|nr:hypothetical protein AAFF_G00021470 [Aldrovandia affinis]
MWEGRLGLLFNPGQDICVDEQLVPFRGRCRFRQYIPNKPAKYGIKIWVACDVATSYAWKMQVYTGKQEGARPEVNQGRRVVLELTEELQGYGHTVSCDNFFTSYALAEELLRRKMALVGTIRRNKPNLLQTRQRAILSSVFAFTKTHTAVSYVPKRGRNVLLLSTKHREPSVVGTYSCRRKSSRWPLTLFYNILDVSAYNAFVLWVAVDPSWNERKKYRRRIFLEQLGQMMITPEMERRTHMPRTPSSAALVAEAQQGEDSGEPHGEEPGSSTTPKKRKSCKLCTVRKRCINTCIKCGIYICRAHTAHCCSNGCN